MPDFRSKSLSVPLSVEAGAAADVNPRSHLALSLSGVFDATVQFEYSPSDSEDLWFPVGGPLSSPGLLYLEPGKAKRIRANTTVYTTGDPKAYSFSDAALANSQREREFKEDPMDVLAGDGEGLAFDLEDGEEALVILSGTFDATMRLQVSLADSDDEAWHDWDTARLSGGSIAVPQGTARRIRLQTSSYVSGTPEARVLYGFTAENNESALKQNEKSKGSGAANFVYTNDPTLSSDGKSIFSALDNPNAWEECIAAADAEEKASGKQVTVTFKPAFPGPGGVLAVPGPSTPGDLYPVYGKKFHIDTIFGFVEFGDGALFDGMPELSARAGCNWQFNSSTPVVDQSNPGFLGFPDSGWLIANTGFHNFRNVGSSPWLKLTGFCAGLCRSGGYIFHYTTAGHILFSGASGEYEVGHQGGRADYAADMFLSESGGDGKITIRTLNGAWGLTVDFMRFDQQPRFSGTFTPSSSDGHFGPIYSYDSFAGNVPFAPINGSATLVQDDGSGNSAIQGIDLSAITANDRLLISGAATGSNNRIVLAGANGDGSGVVLQGQPLSDEGPVSLTFTYVGKIRAVNVIPDGVGSMGLPVPFCESQDILIANDGSSSEVALDATTYGAMGGPENIPSGMTFWAWARDFTLKNWKSLLLGHMNRAPDAPLSGAVDVDTPLTKLDVNVNNTYSLGDGLFEGQIKDLVVASVTSAGTAVLTPANFADGTTVSVSNVGESCSLKWLNGNWHLLSAVGAVIA